jgi:hypothetical protein
VIERGTCSPGISVGASDWRAGVDKKKHGRSKLGGWYFISSTPDSHLSAMNIPMATVVATALGAVTFRFWVVSPILAIAVLIVTRWDRKWVGGTGSHMLTPTHD